MINWKSFCAVRYMFKSMKCEVYAPLEGHYARKRKYLKFTTLLF